MDESLSILISTMYQTDINFVYKMFPEHDVSQLNLIIINQTSKDKLLKSDLENIQIHNSYEFGLSKSRNQAIKLCQTKYAVLADDDLVYQDDFLEIIYNAYQTYPDATLISFQLLKSKDRFYKKYPDESIQLKSRGNPFMLSSSEISINVEKVKQNDLQFCEYFGLGAMFTSCEETLFLRSLLKRNLKAFFVNQPIAIHKDDGTGNDPLGDEFIRAMSACQFFMYGYGSFLWLIYYLYQMKKTVSVSNHQLKKAFKSGSKGINEANQHKKAIVKQL